MVGSQQWVGIPFAGGMAEVAHIQARTLVINDLHRQVINLARVVADPVLGPRLYRELRRLSFHADELLDAQAYCKANDAACTYQDARNYFVAVWMGRSHKAGTDDEFNGGLSVRWNAAGGDSVVRYRSAVRSLREWRTILARATFSTLDVFEFLENVHDAEGHALYCDPPFPGPGDKYRHKFTDEDHAQLATSLAAFKTTRIVCRFYDHPLIRRLYPENGWQWHFLDGGRSQTNGKTPEVLLVNRSAIQRIANVTPDLFEGKS